ncbi:MAG: type IV pilus assembly protein PilM [Armatimonadetes bacterium]|nr:type IV pilus assembly protein PilM [Armatimonadota bacterium]
MAKRLNSVLGIDIGSQSVKVAEIRMQGGQPTITALGMAPTPEGAIDHIGINDPEQISVAIKQAIMEAGASVPDAVSSLSGQGTVLVRPLEVPNMSESELKDHMQWEFTRNIPFAESTVETDFKAYPLADPAAQNLDVDMAIATHSGVTMQSDILKKAGRKAFALDVEPLSVLRSLSVSYGSEAGNKTVCVAEIGHKTTAINIYKNERLIFSRTVPVGGEMFTRAIADSKGVSFQDAERMKHEQLVLPEDAAPAQTFNPFAGSATVQSYNPFADAPEPGAQADAPAEPAAPVPVETNPVYPAVSNALDELVAEIRRSIDYYKTKGGDVDMMLVTGGSAGIKNLDKFLASATGLKVELMDPYRNVSMSLKKGDPGTYEQLKHAFSVAIGNGMHICF